MGTETARKATKSRNKVNARSSIDPKLSGPKYLIKKIEKIMPINLFKIVGIE